MNHIMLDEETMGTRPDAPIMSIGACYFDPFTGEIGDTFHEQIRLDSNDSRCDASTVIWWMKQDDAARSKFFENEKAPELIDVLKRFSAFVKPRCKVWGNGAAFDNVILRHAYDSRGMSEPWKFWDDMDVRTIVEIGKLLGIDPKRDMPFEGVKHDALADAIHQAKYVSLIWQTINLLE